MAMKKARLLKLAEFLEKEVPPNHFDMRHWAERETSDHAPISIDRLFECGTSACALGWAAVVPSFRKAGLRLYKDSDQEETAGVVFTDRLGFDHYEGDAGREFFGLTEAQSQWLFIPSSSPKTTGARKDETPKQVAKRIRNLVAGKVKSYD